MNGTVERGRKFVIGRLIVAVILAGVALGYVLLKSPDGGDVSTDPAITSATTDAGSSQETSGITKTASTATDSASTTQADLPNRNTLDIEIGGSASGIIKIELFNDIAPHHVKRLVALARAGKYNNIVFHRVIDGFMAQTGDVKFGIHGQDIKNAGFGGSDLPDLKAEFSDQKFVAGVVGMARGPNPDSANSQFFIMFDAAPYLNGQYTVVGQVVSGMDVVRSIKKGVTAQNGAVSNPDFMKTVTVE